MSQYKKIQSLPSVLDNKDALSILAYGSIPIDTIQNDTIYTMFKMQNKISEVARYIWVQSVIIVINRVNN